MRHEKVAVPGEARKVDRFARTITLTGALSDEQRARLLDIAEQCPVSQTLRRPSEIVSRLSEGA